MQFNHEKLEVYQISIELLTFIFKIIQKMPVGYGFLNDQLHRASLSIPLNIAEGNAKFSKKGKARFFSIARASANECSAIFDVAFAANILSKDQRDRGKTSLYRIVCMLSKMITCKY